MRFAIFSKNDVRGIALVDNAGGAKGLLETDTNYPGDLDALVKKGDGALADAAKVLSSAPAVALQEVRVLPPFSKSNKVLCVGLNYSDHTAETHYKQPDHPTIFPRFGSTLIGHKAAIVRPKVSQALDYEGEVVAVIGRPGRYIAESNALDHVIGYTIFNDGSVRDYQHRTPQWTLGKNFENTGALGPLFVTADELPQGAKGLKLETRLNGEVVQSSNTDNLIFSVENLVAAVSEALALEAGDLIITGTPAGIGHSRKPPLYMKPGDVVEVEVEGIGTLENHVVDEI
ncbi:fumarylacetoacetate hydrolase family protein [Rhizobium sp. X9]|uniref:fumarylacetoacetate hydrolase family protein n=1 Tax=Rhizobium sp. X9 TaxID=2815360 RepID=UPI001C0E01FF|nr:fumarylacetoacetate hydrolase family protein [Rhizobium sp. X9]